jgi:hypothetical protein
MGAISAEKGVGVKAKKFIRVGRRVGGFAVGAV